IFLHLTDRPSIPVTHLDSYGGGSAGRQDGCPAPVVHLSQRQTHCSVGWAMQMSRSDTAAIRVVPRDGSVRGLRVKLPEGIGLMPQRLRRRLARLRLLLCVAMAALVGAIGPMPLTNALAATSTDCDTQVNDTPSKLLPCIRTDDLWNHMKAFQAIADANPGPDGMPSRNSGEPGYKASVDYVARLMGEAGYDVTIQAYKFFYFAYTAIPAFKEISPTSHDY